MHLAAIITLHSVAALWLNRIDQVIFSHNIYLPPIGHAILMKPQFYFYFFLFRQDIEYLPDFKMQKPYVDEY